MRRSALHFLVSEQADVAESLDPDSCTATSHIESAQTSTE
jgi:hypothetical protein